MSGKYMVLGANGDLGGAITQELKLRGRSVFTHARSSGSMADFIGDLSFPEVADSLSEFIVDSNVDTVFFCAGSYSNQNSPNLDVGAIESAFRSNYLSGVLSINACTKAWSGRVKGRMIVVNSIAALNPNPDEQIYGSLKQALSFFTKAVRLQALQAGIQVTEVFPGAMKTRMTQNRGNWETLMAPETVATAVVNLVEEETLAISAIEIRNPIR